MKKRTPRGQRGSFCAVCASIATALISLGLPAAVRAQELFVTNETDNSVTVYSRTQAGDTAPRRRLAGVATGLDHPLALAVDTVNNELLVANGFGSTLSVTVYERTQSGATEPIRTLVGAATGLFPGGGLAVDTVHNELYVGNLFLNGTALVSSVTVYDRTASGNTVPIRTLAGALTGLDQPLDLVVDTVNDELLVLDNGNDTLTVYNRTASGDTAPIRTLLVSTVGQDAVTGLALDTVNNELFVTNRNFVTDVSTVLVYDRPASGTTAPIRTLNLLPSSSFVWGVAVDTVNNELLVTTVGDVSVMVYDRTASGNAAPIRVISGGNTGLVYPATPAVTMSPPPNAHTTIGLYRPSTNTFFLRNSNTAGFGEVRAKLAFGASGDIPIAGDWNGDSTTTIGLFRPSTNTFLLRNSNSKAVSPDVSVALGAPGDLPIAGDWDGNGTTTVGLFRPSTNSFFLWNANILRPPDIGIDLGAPGDIPIAGDWDGDGTTTIGLFRPNTNTFYLWNSNIAGGVPDAGVAVGAPGDLPIAGDWDGNGTTTIGLFRPSINAFYLWNSNSFSAPDFTILYGGLNDLPLVGNWDGL